MVETLSAADRNRVPVQVQDIIQVAEEVEGMAKVAEVVAVVELIGW